MSRVQKSSAMNLDSSSAKKRFTMRYHETPFSFPVVRLRRMKFLPECGGLFRAGVNHIPFIRIWGTVGSWEGIF